MGVGGLIMEPTDIYEYYIEKTVRRLRTKELREQIRDISGIGGRLVALDFCGKTSLMHKLFSKADVDMFVVYDAVQCMEQLGTLVGGYDIIYVFEDAECIESNVLYKNGMRNVVFLLFDRFRFVRCL